MASGGFGTQAEKVAQAFALQKLHLVSKRVHIAVMLMLRCNSLDLLVEELVETAVLLRCQKLSRKGDRDI